MSNSALNLADDFAVLKPNLTVETVSVSPTVYAELDAKYNQFKNHALVSQYEFSEDWPTWERHPAGDEIVVLLSGKADMMLRVGGKDECVSLREPSAHVVVPAGVWHTAKTSEKTRMLFVTPGEGTENCVAKDLP
ncbi:cupin domain-containing protein [Salinispirillum marinum]|uniref:Cupin domain-containing protein n=2 Tax=Saccharospirillaceae TaxID=255527 RepID=A0ABV8BFF6_9GAMM